MPSSTMNVFTVAASLLMCTSSAYGSFLAPHVSFSRSAHTSAGSSVATSRRPPLQTHTKPGPPRHTGSAAVPSSAPAEAPMGGRLLEDSFEIEGNFEFEDTMGPAGSPAEITMDPGVGQFELAPTSAVLKDPTVGVLHDQMEEADEEFVDPYDEQLSAVLEEGADYGMFDDSDMVPAAAPVSAEDDVGGDFGLFDDIDMVPAAAPFSVEDEVGGNFGVLDDTDMVPAGAPYGAEYDEHFYGEGPEAVAPFGDMETFGAMRCWIVLFM